MTKEDAKDYIREWCPYDKQDEIIKALKQEPCGDAISRQAVQDYIAKYLSQYLYNDIREAVEVIDEYIGELPPVNPQEPKTGHWVVWDTSSWDWTYKCDKCGYIVRITSDYCPNCGARMESEDDNT